ncbi:hypothetical protein GCM10007852_11860 [Agaribacter marinus]|uniref:Uncharacterized protein n=1 Tax=Agaribacter marinus TaxID=1431249 RepID=A0AA37WHR3_9ALTE|nr:hypothetical protein GCM10007852_11860 [Agaribacter marinus]
MRILFIDFFEGKRNIPENEQIIIMNSKDIFVSLAKIAPVPAPKIILFIRTFENLGANKQ